MRPLKEIVSGYQRRSRYGPWIVAALFTISGFAHLTHPTVFTPIVPDVLPRPIELVYASGVVELICAVGLWRRDRWAGIAAAVLSAITWPANLQADGARSRRPVASLAYDRLMGRSSGLFGWRVTRLLIATGAFAMATGFVGIAQAPSSNFAWLAILIGFVLVVASTGQLSDGVVAGPSRSIRRSRVNPFTSRIACLPITPRMPRGVSPPRK